MEITSREYEGWIILDVDGSVRGRSSGQLREECQAFIDKGCRLLCVNFARINFVDSTGLGGLIHCFQKIKALGGNMVLLSLSDDIYDLFEMTSIDKLFTIVDTESELVGLIGHPNT